MTTPAVAPPRPTMAPFKPTMPPNLPPGATTHGIDNTQKIQRFKTPIKIEFVVAASQTAFNLVKAHQQVLKLLQDKDPTLEIIPSKADKATFKDLLKFPANEKDYNEHFEHAVQKEPTEARKILVRHSLLTNLKFSDLKFQNAKLMEHMFKHKIYIKYNQSETLEVAALGFIQDVHPRVTFRDTFSYNLSEAIHLEMTDAEKIKINALLPAPKNTTVEEGEVIKPDIKLEAVARTIGFGNGESRIKTEAFEIRVPLAIRLLIKEILTRLGTHNALPEGRFIPYGLVQSVGSEVYKKMLRMQNIFLTNFRTIPVFGILPQALHHVINVDGPDGTQRQMTVQHFLTSQPSIHGIETTNRANDLGKIFVKSDANNILNARAFIDSVIKELYASGSIPPALILDAFNPPRRSDAPRISTNFQSYASILANLGNPQEDGQAIHSISDTPPPRPPKRNVQMVYDLTTEFPNLPRRTNNNQSYHEPDQDNPQTIQPSHTQTYERNDSNAGRGGGGGRGGGRGGRGGQSQQSNLSPTSAITIDTLAQFKEEMKQEFIAMIRTEVQTQIQTQMQALQTEVGNLTAKIDGMQEGIQENIGTIVRDAIRQSMQPQQFSDTETYLPTDNTQDGACPMSTGTDS